MVEIGGLVLIERELDIAVDIGLGRGGSCGGGEGATSLAERPRCLSFPLISLHSDKDLRF